MDRILRTTSPALLVALALLALAFSSASPPVASANACTKWGSVSPTALSKRHARKAVLCLVNRRRAKAGLRRLDRSKSLQRAAQSHNARMDGTGCFSHQCPGEGNLISRLRTAGYLMGGLSSWFAAENIGWGARSAGTPSTTVRSWMNSPPHRANILDRRVRDIGIGFAQGTPSSGSAAGGIYTADFGLRIGR